MIFGLDSAAITPLRACVQLLVHPKCSKAVQNRILTLLRDMSTITFTYAVDDVTDGLKMLSPFISDILAFMRQKLLDTADLMDTNQVADKKRSRRIEMGGTLSELDLQLLSKLTACVTEPEESETMTTLLLPGLGTKKVKTAVSAYETSFGKHLLP